VQITCYQMQPLAAGENRTRLSHRVGASACWRQRPTR
jgi:hypothetical protein